MERVKSELPGREELLLPGNQTLQSKERARFSSLRTIEIFWPIHLEDV